nr:matrix-remodeling-associated protein 7 [Microcebus murinus]
MEARPSCGRAARHRAGALFAWLLVRRAGAAGPASAPEPAPRPGSGAPRRPAPAPESAARGRSWRAAEGPRARSPAAPSGESRRRRGRPAVPTSGPGVSGRCARLARAFTPLLLLSPHSPRLAHGSRFLFWCALSAAVECALRQQGPRGSPAHPRLLPQARHAVGAHGALAGRSSCSDHRRKGKKESAVSFCPEEEEQDSDGEKGPPQAGPEEEDGEAFSFKYSPGKLRGNQYKKMMTKEELEEEQRVQKEQLAAIFKLMKDHKETFGEMSDGDVQEQLRLYDM